MPAKLLKSVYMRSLQCFRGFLKILRCASGVYIVGKTLPLPWGSGAKSAKVIGEWGNIKKVIYKK
jgi:hypothetical protein